MKRIFTALALLVFVLQVNAQSPKHNIKFSLFSPLVRTGSAFYEHKISKNSTIQLGGFYTGYTLDKLRLRGYGITPEFRFYAGEKGAMNGFYVAPFLRYQHFTLSEEKNKGTLNTIGGGLLIGNQWRFASGINLDAFIGPSYTSGKINVTDGTNDFDLPFGVKGFGIRAGVAIGFSF